jgi:uncharacterized protein YmfQ (DUF2313 family)
VTESLLEAARAVRQDLAYRPMPQETQEFLEDWNRLANGLSRVLAALDAEELQGDAK